MAKQISSSLIEIVKVSELPSVEGVDGIKIVGAGTDDILRGVPINSLAAGSFLNVKLYGAIGDGTSHPLSSRFATLDSAKLVYPFATSLAQEIDWAAIQLAINTAALNAIQVTDDRFYNNNTVFIPKSIGAYVTKDPIYHQFGVTLYGDQPVIKAIGPVDYIVWTKDEGVPTNPTVYGNCNLNILGSIELDGNNLASYGYWGNTVNASQIANLRADRCTRKKWNDGAIVLNSGAFAIAARTFVLNTTSGIALRDHVRIYSNTLGRYMRGSFTVRSVTPGTNTVILVNGLMEVIPNDGTVYSLHHIPSGFLLSGNQFTCRNLKGSFNTCGAAFAVSRTNSSGVPANNDDNYYDDFFFEENDMGIAWINVSGSLGTKITAQHSTYENYIGSNCEALILQRLYNEAGTNFASLGSELYPLAYFHGKSYKIGMIFPSNVSNGWARMVESDVQILTIEVHSGSVIENPSVAGDIALVKHTNRSSVNFTDMYIHICSNFQSKDTIRKAVTNPAYGIPSNRCRITTTDIANGDSLEAGIRRTYDFHEYYTAQEAFARISIRNNGIFFGNGAGAPDTSIVRKGVNDSGPGTNGFWSIDSALKIKKSDGAYLYFFADTQQRLRFS